MMTRTVPAALDQLDEVQGFVDEMLAGISCDPSVVLTLQIAVEEIFVNIASYAYAPETGKAEIRCEVKPEIPRITLQFRDWGIPFNPLARKEADITLSAEERDIGGLGIYMVKNSMDQVSYAYEDGQNILTIQKNLQSDSIED